MLGAIQAGTKLKSAPSKTPGDESSGGKSSGENTLPGMLERNKTQGLSDAVKTAMDREEDAHRNRYVKVKTEGGFEYKRWNPAQSVRGGGYDLIFVHLLNPGKGEFMYSMRTNTGNTTELTDEKEFSRLTNTYRTDKEHADFLASAPPNYRDDDSDWDGDDEGFDPH